MKKWDGFDSAIIGTSNIWVGNERVDVLVYDCEKMVEQLIIRDGMSAEEAVEYIDFNIEGAYIGKDTPVLVWQYDE
ncbi:hypothetical protein EBT25_15400 [bacterium]|jgi:hypothetical protein|nr:hypothetical protein [bacterium]